MAQTKAGAKKAVITTKLRHGEDFYSRAGTKGGAAVDHAQMVRTVKQKHGEDFYRRIGKIGGTRSSRGMRMIDYKKGNVSSLDKFPVRLEKDKTEQLLPPQTKKVSKKDNIFG